MEKGTHLSLGRVYFDSDALTRRNRPHLLRLAGGIRDQTSLFGKNAAQKRISYAGLKVFDQQIEPNLSAVATALPMIRLPSTSQHMLL